MARKPFAIRSCGDQAGDKRRRSRRISSPPLTPVTPLPRSRPFPADIPTTTVRSVADEPLREAPAITPACSAQGELASGCQHQHRGDDYALAPSMSAARRRMVP